MSSIYKKGRDGYYYYQTYVYNKESQKKNKRIFHSLGTKDKEEANKKKIELDERYAKNQKKHHILKNKSLLIATFCITALVTIFLIFSFLTFEDKSNSSFKSNYQYSEDLEIINADSIGLINDFNLRVEEKENFEISETEKLKNKAVEIFDYKVERVENISSSFSQAKIYITIESNHNDGSQLLLCQKIKNEFSEYSNMIICIYKNSPDGYKLANGLKQTIVTPEEKESWLAMYTYNKVEGEYFNNMPTGYLGNN